MNLTGEQVFYERIMQIDDLQESVECGGNHGHSKSRGFGEWHNWYKRSIFWELPYWSSLTLRHNLDVMHIEKNFFDNIMNTLMNVPGKTTDSINSKKDMKEVCFPNELELTQAGKHRSPFSD